MEAKDCVPMHTSKGKVEVPLLALPQAIGYLLDFPQNIGWIFRGEVDSSWRPIPKAGRPPFFKSAKPVFEDQPPSKRNPPPDLGRFNHWKKLAAAYCKELPENPFECLAYAQHYGLPTRLLDFTESPLAALYFATESKFEVDGAIYIYFPWIHVDEEMANFYDLPRNARLNVRPFDRRLLAQHAVFVWFEDPSVPLTPGPIREEMRSAGYGDVDLIKVRIPAKSKLLIHRQLRQLGITRKALFPDVEGLADSIVEEELSDRELFEKAGKDEE